MSDVCLADLCGFCCICCSASLTSYCNTKNAGADGCCGRSSYAGCCGGCCNESFNEDSFDQQVKKDLARTKADPPLAQPQPVHEQPMPRNMEQQLGAGEIRVSEV